MTRGARLTLAGGLLALLLGRVLLALVPSPVAEPPEAWQLPETLHAIPGVVAAGPAIEVPFAEPIDVLHLKQEQRVFNFHRFRFTTQRVDEDLVPWFPDLYDKRWIRVTSRRYGEGPRINAVVLEHIVTGERRTLAWTMRVGPYLSGQFNKAKLLQVPAKLQRQAVFEIFVLGTECNAACSDDLAATTTSLDAMVRLNRSAH